MTTQALQQKYVIVRTYSAGVFAGTLVSRNGKEVTLHNARRIWYWAGAASLSQLAVSGTSKPRVLMTHVMLGDTRSKSNIERMRGIGWGRMFASAPPAPYERERWGFDNGAFKAWQDAGKPIGLTVEDWAILWDCAEFERRLDVAIDIGTPYLAVVPDIPGSAASLQYSIDWLKELPKFWPWYLAVQDGMSIWDVEPHLHLFDGIFMGGSDDFKSKAWTWCKFAQDRGKPFHYARAGTLNKLESALKMKANSLDSTFPLWEKRRMKQFIEQFHYWNEFPRPQLFEH